DIEQQQQQQQQQQLRGKGRGVALRQEGEAEDAAADDDDDDDTVSRRSPHHRHYLSYEGVGSGTPRRRERQYRQHKMRRATENVFKYRMEKYGESDDTEMVMLDKKATRRRHKISNTMDRVVEDLIQDAMSKGEFHNLSGAGKPLEFKSASSSLDVHTHTLNQVLINNGYTPEWIVKMKEIREHLELLRHTLATHYTEGDSNLTPHAVDKFRTGLRDINDKIDKYNMIVPVLHRQMVHYNCSRQVASIRASPQAFLRPHLNVISARTLDQKDALRSDPIKWAQVWKDIKAVFK
ncbi:dnaJ homolog subfamily C member 28-like, partial [Argonauta hians]